MSKFTAFSDRDIGGRERLEDATAHLLIPTQSGFELQVGIICDGLGGLDVGERASYVAINAIQSAIRSSTKNNVPEILHDAVSYANQMVLNEMNSAQARGSTTVAMFAIDVNDGEYGRLFIASVGDSCIYILRADDENGSPRMIRLNRDHTRGYDMVMRGEVSLAQLPQVPQGHHLTRALGVIEDVEIDTGIYASKEHEVAPLSYAEKFGRRGLPLQEGDTVFASSDGFFDINPDDNETFVHEDEFLRHALDNNVEKAARTLIAYATARGVSDNVSISMLFVDSPRRKVIQPVMKLSPTQKVMAGVGTGVVVLIIAMLVGFLLIQGGDIDEQAAQLTEIAANEAARTATAMSYTSTPTATATATATPIPTATPLPTLTPRPIVAANSVAVIYDANRNQIGELAEGQPYSSPGEIHTVINGAVDTQIVDTQPGIWLPFSGTGFTLQTVRNTSNNQQIAMTVQQGTDAFFNLGVYNTGGTTMGIVGSGLSVTALSSCLSIEVQPEYVAFTCYNGQDGDCNATFNNAPIALAANTYYQINLRDGSIITSGHPWDLNAANIQKYYETSVRLVNRETATCLGIFADPDGDTLVGAADICPDESGSISYPDYPGNEGCPDTDADGVPNPVDECPETGQSPYGMNSRGCANPPPDTDGDGVANNVDGCPTERGSQAMRGCPDTDGDGVADDRDRCPFVVGLRENNGCPVDGSE